MKTAIAAIISAALLGANAAPTKRTVGGAPFYLSLGSSDATLNGVKLGTCQIGAGIESICAYPDDVALFQSNTTSGNLPPGVTDAGKLVWYLQEDPQVMGLNTLIDSNVAPAIFGLDAASVVGYNEDQKMGFINYYNDATNPPSYINGGELLTDRWRMCQYNFEGYVYNTLSWEYGSSAATQPSCQAVTVTRIYQ